MDAVLSDDRLNQSEIVYSFLSPSPDYLKKSANELHLSKLGAALDAALRTPIAGRSSSGFLFGR